MANAVLHIEVNEVKVPTYPYKLVYDSTTNRSWAHWQENREGRRWVGRSATRSWSNARAWSFCHEVRFSIESLTSSSQELHHPARGCAEFFVNGQSTASSNSESWSDPCLA